MTDICKPRRRWSFSLRTLFVIVTIFGVWLGYHVNWIRNRRDGWTWLQMHGVGGAIGFVRETRPSLPWSLKVLGEKPLEMYWIGADDEEQKDLKAYRMRVAEIARLYPECQIVDIDAVDREIEDSDDSEE